MNASVKTTYIICGNGEQLQSFTDKNVTIATAAMFAKAHPEFEISVVEKKEIVKISTVITF